jgi:hypothetical protein
MSGSKDVSLSKLFDIASPKNASHITGWIRELKSTDLNLKNFTISLQYIA